MKKLAIIVSIICAFLFTAMGIKSVSANEMPTYCVIVDSDYGFSDNDHIMGMLEEKIQGDLMNPQTTVEALENIAPDKEVSDLSTEELQALGKTLPVDYVVVLRVYNDSSYDDNIHNVNCVIDVVKTATGGEMSYMGNVLVAKGFVGEDENRDALEQFIEFSDPIELK